MSKNGLNIMSETEVIISTYIIKRKAETIKYNIVASVNFERNEIRYVLQVYNSCSGDNTEIFSGNLEECVLELEQIVKKYQSGDDVLEKYSEEI